MRGVVVLGMLGALLLPAGGWAREVPALSRRVHDETGTLAPALVDHLEHRLRTYEQSTGHQFAVLVIQSLEGEVLEPFTLQVAERWRLGDEKRDDGVLLLVSIADRAVRIEVGHGLEGAVPDVVASRIIRETIVPRFQVGDYSAGIEQGLEALMKAAENESRSATPPSQRPAPNWSKWGMLVVLGVWTALRTRRSVRSLLLGGIGGIVGFGLLHSVLWASGLGLLGLVFGFLLPTLSLGSGNARRPGPRQPWSTVSTRTRGMGGIGIGGFGGFGGFSGGGGSFGGGGASGRW